MTPHEDPPRTVGPTLREQFGDIDIYLFDQLLKGRVTPRTRVLDAGCGSGRNLVYLARLGCDLTAVDRDPEAVRRTRRLIHALRPEIADDRFRVEAVERLSFADGAFDLVVASAVLHFADTQAHFDAMVDELWRVLAPGGILFARLASSIGIEHRIVPLGHGRFTLPDGSDRYLVDEAALVAATARLGGVWLDPLKTTNVQGQRCMTTWCVGRT